MRMRMKNRARMRARMKKKTRVRNIALALFLTLVLVPRAGIEPALPKEQDFESSASTSSATEASFGIFSIIRFLSNNRLSD